MELFCLDKFLNFSGINVSHLLFLKKSAHLRTCAVETHAAPGSALYLNQGPRLKEQHSAETCLSHGERKEKQWRHNGLHSFGCELAQITHIHVSLATTSIEKGILQVIHQ